LALESLGRREAWKLWSRKIWAHRSRQLSGISACPTMKRWIVVIVCGILACCSGNFGLVDGNSQISGRMGYLFATVQTMVRFVTYVAILWISLYLCWDIICRVPEIESNTEWPYLTLFTPLLLALCGTHKYLQGTKRPNNIQMVLIDGQPMSKYK
jgi:magnesium-transporting ATPase (P-type)